MTTLGRKQVDSQPRLMGDCAVDTSTPREHIIEANMNNDRLTHAVVIPELNAEMLASILGLSDLTDFLVEGCEDEDEIAQYATSHGVVAALERFSLIGELREASMRSIESFFRPIGRKIYPVDVTQEEVDAVVDTLAQGGLGVVLVQDLRTFEYGLCPSRQTQQLGWTLADAFVACGWLPPACLVLEAHSDNWNNPNWAPVIAAMEMSYAFVAKSMQTRINAFNEMRSAGENHR